MANRHMPKWFTGRIIGDGRPKKRRKNRFDGAIKNVKTDKKQYDKTISAGLFGSGMDFSLTGMGGIDK
jgi:hypothetical protein